MVIFTDGSARRNGSEDSVGGFGVVVVENNVLKDTYQMNNIPGATNNEMELSAIVYVLRKYGLQQPAPIVYSDSAYCVNTLTNWMYGWAERGWRKSDKKIPENLELIKNYYELENQGYKIDLRLCKGHDGNVWNELADKLATGSKKG